MRQWLRIATSWYHHSLARRNAIHPAARLMARRLVYANNGVPDLHSGTRTNRRSRHMGTVTKWAQRPAATAARPPSQNLAVRGYPLKDRNDKLAARATAPASSWPGFRRAIVRPSTPCSYSTVTAGAPCVSPLMVLQPRSRCSGTTTLIDAPNRWINGI